MRLSLASRQPGYWGTVTSEIDWCEENYTISLYVAEFWNTLSSLAFVLLSSFGVFWVWKHRLEERFLLAYASTGVIGIGSVLFHATLKRTSQLLDEVPMLFGMATLLFAVLETTTKVGTDEKQR